MTRGGLANRVRVSITEMTVVDWVRRGWKDGKCAGHGEKDILGRDGGC